MRELLIACEMLKDETREALQQTGRDFPVVWIDRGLHEYPARLRETLLAHIKEAEKADVIMLTFSYCGGAIDGIYSERSTLVIPLFDDCIRMFKSSGPGCRGITDPRTLYLTAGWIESERSLYADYLKACERYGQPKAQRIYCSMLKSYRSIELMDTQSYDIEAFRPRAELEAAEFGLSFQTGTGSLRILKKLFTRDWDEEF